MNTTKGLTSAGAIAGIAYVISKSKSFWGTAAYCVAFALGGCAIGIALQSKNNNS